VERRVRAGNAALRVIRRLFLSITALISDTNIGYPAVTLGVSALLNTLSLVRHAWNDWRRGRLWQPGTLLVGSIAIYGLQIWFAAPLIHTPRATDDVYGLSYLLLGAYGVGLGRAWFLLGAAHEGPLTLLGLRHERGLAAPGTAGGGNASLDGRAARPK